MEKKKIYIIGGCRGCGATFVAAGLAFAMGRRPEGEKKGIAYLEGVSHDDGPGGSGHSLPYYELSLDRHISAGRFSDMFAVKREGKDPSNRLNLYGNVNWAVRTDMSPAGVFVSGGCGRKICAVGTAPVHPERPMSRIWSSLSLMCSQAVSWHPSLKRKYAGNSLETECSGS